METAISQQLLERLVVLHAEYFKIGKDYKEAREALLTLDAAGAPVEEGARSYRIVLTSSQRLSKEKLIDFLGQEEADRIITGVAPSVQRNVKVFVVCATAEPGDFDDDPPAPPARSTVSSTAAASRRQA